MAGKDYYKLLEVDRSASEAEIKKSFRRLAKKYHPDVNPGNKAAEEKFKEITEAYAVLSDAEKRKRYDTMGPEGFQSGFDFSDFFRNAGRGSDGQRTYHWSSGGGQEFNFDLSGLEDIFGSFFGGRRDGFSQARTPRETTYNLDVDFLTAARGGEVDLSLDGDRVRVKIPAGVDTGQTIRLPGKKILLQLHVQADSRFDRKGNDIYIDTPVSLSEALLGASIEVPTIDGSANVTLPPGTSSGQKLRLKGKGVPGRDGKRGDQYIRILISVPKKIDARSKELIEEFAKRNPENPRI